VSLPVSTITELSEDESEASPESDIESESSFSSGRIGVQTRRHGSRTVDESADALSWVVHRSFIEESALPAGGSAIIADLSTPVN
jgi:hypothetical protein